MLDGVKREYIYDYIRVFACVCIIGIHTSDILINGNTFDNIWWIGIFIQGIVRIGLPLFVLLSGVLALNNKKEEKVGYYYSKRFFKIVVPLFFYSMFYVFVYDYNYSMNFFKLVNLVDTIKNISFAYVHYHLWYVYMIIGIYLCVPFLRKMCNNLNTSECKWFLGLIFLIPIVKYILPLIDIKIGITVFLFEGWLLYFLLGYFVNKNIILKHYKLFYVLGIFSFFFSIVAKRYFPEVTGVNDLSITMIFQAIMVYLLFYRNKDKIASNIYFNKIILILSKYSFGIFLIHVYVLDSIRNIMISFWLRNVFGTILFTILVFWISFILVYIIDKVVVNSFKKMFNHF